MRSIRQRIKGWLGSRMQSWREKRARERAIYEKWRNEADMTASKLMAGALSASDPANISPWTQVAVYKQFDGLSPGTIKRMVEIILKDAIKGRQDIRSFELSLEHKRFDTILMQLRLRRT